MTELADFELTHVPSGTAAKGLLQDFEAVYQACSLPWSNGQVEGNINRLKLLKRQMFGRAKFDLLRIRMLYFARLPETCV